MKTVKHPLRYFTYTWIIIASEKSRRIWVNTSQEFIHNDDVHKTNLNTRKPVHILLQMFYVVSSNIAWIVSKLQYFVTSIIV